MDGLKSFSGDHDYLRWFRQVLDCVEAVTGTPCEGLPPRPYEDWYASGLEPARAARRVLHVMKEMRGPVDDIEEETTRA